MIREGYEQFEIVTGNDGTFKFVKLYPLSEYQLIIYSERWAGEKKIKFESGPKGQTRILTSPVIIRFMESKEGVSVDTKTGLEWYPCPDQSMRWDIARSWVAGLQVAGGGWRMPTVAELSTLYIKDAGEYSIAPIFKLDSYRALSGEQRDATSSRTFDYRSGKVGVRFHLDVGTEPWAIAVRSRK